MLQILRKTIRRCQPRRIRQHHKLEMAHQIGQVVVSNTQESNSEIPTPPGGKAAQVRAGISNWSNGCFKHSGKQFGDASSRRIRQHHNFELAYKTLRKTIRRYHIWHIALPEERFTTKSHSTSMPSSGVTARSSDLRLNARQNASRD